MDLLKRRLDIAHVIAREFLGIQEKGEQNLLECWLQEDERHRMEYEEIRQLLVAGEEAWKELEDGDLVAAACWQESGQRPLHGAGCLHRAEYSDRPWLLPSGWKGWWAVHRAAASPC